MTNAPSLASSVPTVMGHHLTKQDCRSPYETAAMAAKWWGQYLIGCPDRLDPRDGDSALEAVAAWRQQQRIACALAGTKDLGEFYTFLAEHRVAFEGRFARLILDGGQTQPIGLSDALDRNGYAELHTGVSRAPFGVLSDTISWFAQYFSLDTPAIPGCPSTLRQLFPLGQQTVITASGDRSAVFVKPARGLHHMRLLSDMSLVSLDYDRIVALLETQGFDFRAEVETVDGFAVVQAAYRHQSGIVIYERDFRGMLFDQYRAKIKHYMGRRYRGDNARRCDSVPPSEVISRADLSIADPSARCMLTADHKHMHINQGGIRWPNWLF